MSVQTKAVDPPIKSALSVVHDTAPRRRWASLVVPFLLVVVSIAAWRTDPQTWRQLRLATFGETPSDSQTATSGLSKNSDASADSAFAGKGEIDVDGGLLKLFPLAYGEIEEVAVRENSRINVGDILLRIRNKAGSLLIDEAKQGVALAEIDVEKAARAPQDLQKQIQLAEIAVQSEEKMVGVAKRSLDHLKTISQQVSEESVRTANDAVSVAQQRLDARRLDLDRLKLKRPQEDVRTAQAALDRAKTKLAEAVEDSERYVLRARTSGIVMRVGVSAGETFSPAVRDPAFLLCPDKPWIVRCEIEQEFAGRVHVGMDVEVRDDAAGEKIANGVVDRVSGIFAPRRQPVDDSRLHNDFRTMECTVVLKSNHDKLRIGQHVRTIFRSSAPTTKAADKPSSK